MSLSELQKEVFNKAEKMLSKKSWFQGVCVDNFPTDKEIEKWGIDRAAQKVYDITYMWDGYGKE